MFVPRLKLDGNEVTVTQWGIIDDLIFSPGDTLVLGTAEQGDLLLLQPYGVGQLKVGRLYNGHLIVEPHGRSVTASCWEILGGIKGIEKPLCNASLGRLSWFVRIYNLPSEEAEWAGQIESQSLDAMYLTELARQISIHYPEASIKAVREKSQYDSIPLPQPGMISYCPNKTDTCAQSLGKWALASRRTQRRAWENRRKRIQQVELYPLGLAAFPDATSVDKLASK